MTPERFEPWLVSSIMPSATIVGLGNMGREHRAVYEEEGFEVHLDSKKTDYVSICLPDHLHGAHVIKCLRRGQKVFVEKPVCTSDTEFLPIFDYVLRHPDSLGCNFPLRFQKKFQRLKRLVEQDALGDIYYVQATYHWGRREKLDTTWRADAQYSFMLGGGIHMIDLVKWLFPGKMEVLGRNFANNSVQIGALRLNSGALCQVAQRPLAQIVADFGSNRGDHWHKIELRGTKSHLTVTNHRPTDKRAGLRAFLRGEPNPTSSEILDVMECALNLAK